MHRIVHTYRGIASTLKTNDVIKGWSVLSRPSAQRTSSTGTEFSSGSHGTRGSNDDVSGVRGNEQSRGAEGDTKQAPSGRGRGALTNFVRLNERKISQNIETIEKPAPTSKGKGMRNRQEGSVSGQFDDAKDETFKGSSQPDGSWQKAWFSQEDRKSDEFNEEEEMGDIQELDDCEEDDHFDPNEEYDGELWKGYTEEEFKQFQIWGAKLEQEEVEQMASLQAKWKETKAEAEKKYGTSAHLDLPDIIISHEFSYDAPPGMATADRAMPLPRPMETLVDSMELPPDLDVTPDDPEYEQVVNMWTSIARNHTMDERMKKSMIGQISTFIAKYRNSDAFQKSLEMQDFPQRGGKRPR